MDTQSYLMSLGWAGPGHPLHPSAYKQRGHRGLAYDPSSARTDGLIKPLLISKKSNNLGLGRRAHEPQAGNEWWLKGFEKALGDIGKSESERSSGVSTPVNGTRSVIGGKHSGLYDFFVKGQQMTGTINGVDEKEVRRGIKRKSDAIDATDHEEERATAEFEVMASFLAARDDEKKASRRKAKNTAQQDFEQARQYFRERDAKSGKKYGSETDLELQTMEAEETKTRSKDRSRKKHESAIEADDESATRTETREERQERRKRRRQEKDREKEARKNARKIPTPPPEEVHDNETTLRRARKEERRRRKDKDTK